MAEDKAALAIIMAQNAKMFGYFGGLVISILILMGGVIYWFICPKGDTVE
jgi:hypothetical protein